MYTYPLPSLNNSDLSKIIFVEVFSEGEIDLITKKACPANSSDSFYQYYPQKTFSEIKSLPLVFDFGKVDFPDSLAKKLSNKIDEINNRFFQFDITTIIDLHLLRLSSEQYLPWHLEIGSGEYSRRKLGVLIALNDSALERVEWKPTPVKYWNRQKNMAIFPSFMMKQIKLGLQDADYLAGWVEGYPFS